MSVDSFYFCADRAQVETWWRQPISQTSDELTRWRLGDRPTHWALLDDTILGEVLLPRLQSVQDKYTGRQSLGQACRISLGHLSGESRSKPESMIGLLRSFLHFSDKKEALREVAAFGEIYASLLQAARKGPVNYPVDVRLADEFFAAWLEQFLPPDIALQYNGSHKENTRGVCQPSEFGSLSRRLADDLEWQMNLPYLMDAETWRKHWERLEQIPGLWEKIEAALAESPARYRDGGVTGLRGTSHVRLKVANPPTRTEVEMLARYANAGMEIDTRIIVEHLRAIGPIAEYALGNNLAMLRTFC